MYLTPPLKGFPWNWVSAQGVKKLEWWATRWSKKFFNSDGQKLTKKLLTKSLTTLSTKI